MAGMITDAAWVDVIEKVQWWRGGRPHDCGRSIRTGCRITRLGFGEIENLRCLGNCSQHGTGESSQRSCESSAMPDTRRLLIELGARGSENLATMARRLGVCLETPSGEDRLGERAPQAAWCVSSWWSRINCSAFNATMAYALPLSSQNSTS